MKVICPEILIGLCLGQHMVDNYQDTVSNSHYRFLCAQARLEMTELRRKIIITHAGENPGNLRQNRTQVGVAFGWFATAPFACTETGFQDKAPPMKRDV